jgi:PAS domain S-box-containing protein
MNNTPDKEAQRIEALKRYRISGTSAEQAFDNIAKLAVQIFKVPISLISLVDENEVYFKANEGMGDVTKSARGISLCSLAILNPEVTVYENALIEPCLLSNPNVAGNFGLRFYAGAPITTPDGFRIGTICIIDKKPREFSKDESVVLEGLAKIVMDAIEIRLSSVEKIISLEIANHEVATVNAEMTATNEELAATNEEINATNEELIQALRELTESKAQTALVNDKLLKEQQRVFEMFMHAPMGLAFFSKGNYEIEYANEAICRIWNKGTPTEVLGCSMFDLIQLADENTVRAIFDEVLETGRPFIQKEGAFIYNKTEAEKTYYFDLQFAPVYDGERNVTSMLALVNDVTAQVEARESLKSKDWELDAMLNQFEFLTNSIPQQVWTAQPNGLLDYVNLQVQEYFGKQHDELVGENWQFVVHPDDLEMAGKAWHDSLQTGETYQTEFRLLTKEQTYRWHLARAQPYIKDGILIKWFGTNTDIEDQKQAAERKDEFISVASHELKTPLTSLSASLQLLTRIYKANTESPLIPNFIEKSNSNLKKLINLVDDLMNVSKLKHGKLPLKLEKFNLSALVHEVCEDYRDEKTHQINFQSDEHIEVMADYQRVTQVVINLISNAIKYAPGSDQVNVSIEKTPDCVKVSVQDFGIGIADDKLPLLFDRYYRVDNSGIQFSGLGIGLHICGEIVERHQGRIGVESVLGHGSTFWFELPLIYSSNEV